MPARDWAGLFDTAWLDFTKGLGAPVGAVLAGSRELIDEAWRYKQMWGGAMRQAGIIAAAGLYALDHHVDRLAEDHENARALAEGLAELPGVELDPDEGRDQHRRVRVPRRRRRCARSSSATGVQMGAVGAATVRAVTHLDVDRDGMTSTPRSPRVRRSPARSIKHN